MGELAPLPGAGFSPRPRARSFQYDHSVGSCKSAVGRTAPDSIRQTKRDGPLVMKKAHILDEIRRTAETNRGVPLGSARFEAETGIKQTDW